MGVYIYRTLKPLKWRFFFVIDNQRVITFLKNNPKIAWKIQTFYLSLLYKG